jgi:hypothetical protein
MNTPNRKKTTMLRNQLRALLTIAVAIILTLVGMQPASAGTTGTVINGTSYAIWTSSTYPTINSQGPLYYGNYRKAQAFNCPNRCVSPWGYNYGGRGWVAMTTAGDLYLHN